MICPYCNQEALFMTTKEYYGRDYGTNIYVCRPCDATVGTHKRTDKPKGTLANKRLRDLRVKVHTQFDILWKEHDMSRTAAYRYLQEIMEIPEEEAHIGMFDEKRCLMALDRLSKNNSLSPVKTGFKSRGHFCNYCRKVISNISPKYNHHVINPSIWYVWNNQDLMPEFIDMLKSLKPSKSVKGFNGKLKQIANHYKHLPGYGSK